MELIASSRQHASIYTNLVGMGNVQAQDGIAEQSHDSVVMQRKGTCDEAAALEGWRYSALML